MTQSFRLRLEVDRALPHCHASFNLVNRLEQSVCEGLFLGGIGSRARLFPRVDSERTWCTCAAFGVRWQAQRDTVFFAGARKFSTIVAHSESAVAAPLCRRRP